jgi:hypothetical protein
LDSIAALSNFGVGVAVDVGLHRFREEGSVKRSRNNVDSLYGASCGVCTLDLVAPRLHVASHGGYGIVGW